WIGSHSSAGGIQATAVRAVGDCRGRRRARPLRPAGGSRWSAPRDGCVPRSAGPPPAGGGRRGPAPNRQSEQDTDDGTLRAQRGSLAENRILVDLLSYGSSRCCVSASGDASREVTNEATSPMHVPAHNPHGEQLDLHKRAKSPAFAWLGGGDVGGPR